MTYVDGVCTHFQSRLSRPEMAAMGENGRRIGLALKANETPATLNGV